MRRPERIPIILEKLEDDTNKEIVLKHLFKDAEYNIAFSVIKWNDMFNIFKQVYTDNPYLRITQVLVNTGIIPNVEGFWYYTEDEPLLVETNILQQRDIYFWGRNFNKEGKQLPNTEYVLIKDMETPHIQSILRDNEEGLLKTSKYYLEMFNDELRLRKL